MPPIEHLGFVWSLSDYFNISFTYLVTRLLKCRLCVWYVSKVGCGVGFYTFICSKGLWLQLVVCEVQDTRGFVEPVSRTLLLVLGYGCHLFEPKWALTANRTENGLLHMSSCRTVLRCEHARNHIFLKISKHKISSLLPDFFMLSDDASSQILVTAWNVRACSVPRRVVLQGACCWS